MLQTGIAPEFVLFLDCSEEVMKKRLLSRYQVRQVHPYIFQFCPRHLPFSPYPLLFFLHAKGREDDNINTIMKRFKVFKECTLPVIEYYSSKGKVHKVIYCFIKL